MYPTHVANQFFERNNWYLVPFTKDFSAALAGSLGHGYINFSASTAAPFLAITPGVTAVDPVDTITMAGTAAGFYRLSFTRDGVRCYTDPLAHTTSGADIAAALQALPNFQDADGNPMTCVVSQGFNVGNVNIIYKSDTFMHARDRTLFHTLHGDTVRGATTRTSGGKVGWNATASGTYDVVVFAYMAKRVDSHPSGQLTVEDN